MKSLVNCRMALLGLTVGLAACTNHSPYDQPTRGPVLGPTSQQPINAPTTTQPGSFVPPVTVPSTAAPIANVPSPNYAPPPGGRSHWDTSLGVHVLDDQPNSFYRQRTFYHWDHGWSMSTDRNGPWQAIDVSGVPPQLSRHYANQ